MGMCGICKKVLSVLLIALNVLGFVLGAALMSLAAWQWYGYMGSQQFFDMIFGNSRQILIFFLSGGAALMVLSIIGILAGLASLFARLRYLAAMLLVLYTSVLFALYTLEVVSLSLDFGQYFASKGQTGPAVKSAFVWLLNNDLGFNSSAAAWIQLVQSTSKCCGYNNGLDYAETATAIWFYNSDMNLYTNSSVYRPRSCCGALNTTISTVCNEGQTNYYGNGCAISFVAQVFAITWSFLGIGVAAAVVEALVLILPLFLIGLVLSARCAKGEKE